MTGGAASGILMAAREAGRGRDVDASPPGNRGRCDSYRTVVPVVVLKVLYSYVTDHATGQMPTSRL